MSAEIIESGLPEDEPPITFTEPDTPPLRAARKRQPPPKQTASGRSTQSEKDARIAAGILAQANGLIAFGIAAVGYHGTAGAIAVANEGFEEQAYDALVNDPVLCKQILRAGSTGGKAALILAYGVMVMSVTPIAYAEMREKREAKRVEAENAERIGSDAG